MGRHPHDWSEAEDDILRDIWHGVGFGTIRERVAALIPTRTYYAAEERASKLGLSDRDEAALDRAKAEVASAKLLALLQEHHGGMPGGSR